MMKRKVKSSLFVLGASFSVWALASVSAQVRVPDIPRIPSVPTQPHLPTIPHEPNINGPTIVLTPPPETPEPPHFHPHHNGHSELSTPEPTIAPYSPPR